MRRCIILLGIVAAGCTELVFAQTQLAISPELYKQRRLHFIAQMPDSSLALFFAAEPKTRINDTYYPYRQDNALFYLSGCPEPFSVLILFKSPVVVGQQMTREVLFVQPRDPSEEIWTGRRLGAAGARQTLQVEVTETIDKLEEFLTRFAKEQRTAFTTVLFPNTHLRNRSAIPTAQLSTEQLFKQAGFIVQSALPILAKMRVTKSPEEIRLIQKATDITVAAHLQAIMSCEPDMYEYELAAVAEYVFKRMGCAYTAYPSIVGSGENSVILHYDAVRKKMRSGELVVMDMAGEYEGYASDVTRTIPVSGKFSPEQRAIYELVLKAQEAAIAECRAGNPFHAPHLKAVEVIADGLLKLGIIQDRRDYRRYFMHGSSHHVGLDVHDPSFGTLGENQVITVEPGIYIAEGSLCDRKWWNIGVRIEDVVLITKDGPRVLSAALPKNPDAIETLMQQRGLGNLALPTSP
ncbi:MAG: aminopeptidase P N-terminal domain-containing protein [Chloroherpetonaceae bacterium]|nr:aminopeptidase P N-terminal domain-containing protein [Chloroherpetonaceae bacterium]